MASSDVSLAKKLKKSSELRRSTFEKTHNVTDDTRAFLEELDCCQSSIDKLNDEASEEILTLERNICKSKRPILLKRSDILRRIKHFWVITFINHPQISTILDEEEEECLNYMLDLQVHDFDDLKSGFRITFVFDENPYLFNSELTKVIRFHDNVVRSESTRIEWRPGQNLIERISSRAQKARSSRKRPSDCKSFFVWFEDNENPSRDDLADVIRDDIWPNPLQYFLVPDVEEENVVTDEDQAVDAHIIEVNEDESRVASQRFEAARYSEHR